ncbi:Ger(x)C family spore germination protein [Neobacillus cucumis]|uniref:Ger(x)C family spore germination protein n=1 Tax=Neobacillus cucumis TaxID=1740721 RepID=UPI00285300D9|nr:Ger(x)C family spore germination protein [Neobacillus cucumis]MDR4947088.1 Ger(x)C family spore germination protein [Neobacillus cucumis]
MKNLIIFIILINLSLIVTGCFGAKRLEGEVYITALGFDYKNGKFEVFSQGLNFGNIAKQEGANIEDLPILVGEAKDESLLTAYGELEQTTAMPLSLGHVQAIILTERILKEKMADVMDIMGQSPNLRYNLFVFGTKENIKDLFQTESFFNYSQLYSIIHVPEPLIQQNYSLPILRYHEFTSRYYRPIGTIMIPTLSINKAHFSEGKQKQIAIINGEYIMSHQQYKGWLNKKDLTGIRWFSKGIQGFSVRVGTKKVSVKIKNPKTKIVVLKGNQPSYRIAIKGQAALFQNSDNKTNSGLQNVLNKKIKKDILTTLEKGDKLNTDVLNISEKSYKYHLNHWDIGTIRRFNLDAVKDIKVDIKIIESGKYK